jgi:hypothetical protein
MLVRFRVISFFAFVTTYFALAAHAAANLSEEPRWIVIVGGVTYFAIWFNATDFAITSMSNLYGFRLKPFGRRFMQLSLLLLRRSRAENGVFIFGNSAYDYSLKLTRRFMLRGSGLYRQNDRANTIVGGLYSYLLAIFGFALTYIVISANLPGSFNVEKLDVVSSIYFSTSTIATVGFGDIVPLSRIARILVTLEIFTGLFYAVFFFSVAAAFARERKRFEGRIET